MNTERLKKLLDGLIAQEAELDIQKHLQNLTTYLQQHSQNPADQNNQKNVSNGLKTLRQQVEKFLQSYTPLEIERLDEIGASKYFTANMSDEIATSMNENAMSPAVAHQTSQHLLSQRQSYLTQITNTANGLTALGFEPENLEAGEAEIGFMIPRDIFKNDLNGLTKELRAVSHIIRAFAENTSGTSEPIIVKQISTSDPIFFFGLSVEVVVAIGAAVSWGLKTWKDIEEIRKVRAETQKLTMPNQDDILKKFDDNINDTIKIAIQEQVEALSASANKKQRANHEKQLGDALNSLLERLERGMSVEIKCLPPKSNEDEDQELNPDTELYDKIKEISESLEFPKIESSPILNLSYHEKNDPEEK